MSVRIKIKIDGVTEFNGDPGDWVNRPPDLFKDLINPQARPQPWMKSIALIMSEAVMSGRGVSIAVRTSIGNGRPGWTMEVAYQ